MSSNRVTLSNSQIYPFQLPWDGRLRLRGTFKSPLAFDTETEPVNRADPTHVPRLALATASDGRHSLILRPDQLAAFILLHQHEHWVGQNMAFDFWVVDKYLHECNLPRRGPARTAWFRIADEGRLHDTLLLDMLIRLAQAAGFEAYAKKDTSLARRNLGELAWDYCNIKVDKEDPFRLRYAELIGVDWATVHEQGFWDYAIKDAIVTQLVFKKQMSVAQDLHHEAQRQHPREFHNNCRQLWGFLTESLQTRASLVLAQMERRGMHVDRVQAQNFENRLREEMAQQVRQMWEHAPDVFKYHEAPKPRRRKGQPPPIIEQIPRTPENIKRTVKSNTPSMTNKALMSLLKQTACEHGFRPPLSDGKKKGISLSAKAWYPHRKKTPFLEAWVKLARLTKALSFFALFHESSVLYPKYSVLMRTGRTSASRPNLQQMPRDGDFRSLFVARAGTKLFTIDYSYIELRTLAVVCEKRYGWSRLADTIRQHIDPHVYTAAMVLGLSLEEFLTLKETDNARFKAARQKAKVVNFGVPGGLGAVKLAAYARSSYGVDMTVEEAYSLRTQLVQQVYPELDLYLGDTSLTNIAWNFGVSQAKVKQAFDLSDEGESLAHAACRG